MHPTDKVINKRTSIQFGQSREISTTTCTARKLKYFEQYHHVVYQEMSAACSPRWRSLFVADRWHGALTWLDLISMEIGERSSQLLEAIKAAFASSHLPNKSHNTPQFQQLKGINYPTYQISFLFLLLTSKRYSGCP